MGTAREHRKVGQGLTVLFTPLGGSWLNLAESIQGILVRRALTGTHPKNPQEVIGWLEAVARAWNRDPTPLSGAADGRSAGTEHGSGAMPSADLPPAHPAASAERRMHWMNGDAQAN